LALFVYLGLWQQGKGERLASSLVQRQERASLETRQLGQALVDATEMLDMHVKVKGVFDVQGQFFLDNRQHLGQPGVHVITPLQIDGGKTRVLVNRGWIGWGASRQVLPVVPVPTGEVVVSGVTALPSQKGFFLMPDRPEAFAQLWPRLDLKRYADRSGYAVQPLVIQMVEQLPAEQGVSLVREWPAPPDRVGMHKGYAVQWFGMALALLVFYGVASTRRTKR
jgi:surfeit locus 1 family protein